jgi:hypothetical protein
MYIILYAIEISNTWCQLGIRILTEMSEILHAQITVERSKFSDGNPHYSGIRESSTAKSRKMPSIIQGEPPKTMV